MKAGFLQMEPILGESPNNALKAQELLERSEKFDLVVLPELANTGYAFRDRDEAMALAEDTDHSHFVDILQKIAANRKCHIITGFCERDGDRLFNSSLLIGEQGVIGRYHKIHLFNREKEYFTPGESQPEIYTIGDWKIGMMICFDWAFPEVWRILAIRGADLVAHPANLIVVGGGHAAIPVYARINAYYVITSNRIGTERNLKFTGESLIVSPDGSVTARAGSDSEDIRFVEMDLKKARDKNITDGNHLLNDRRPDLYKGLC